MDVVGCILGAEMPNLLAMLSRDVKQFVVYKTTCGLPAVGLSVIPSDVCDGQEPVRSTYYGRHTDRTVIRYPMYGWV